MLPQTESKPCLCTPSLEKASERINRGLWHTQKTYLMLLSIALRVREEEKRKANEVIVDRKKLFH